MSQTATLMSLIALLFAIGLATAQEERPRLYETQSTTDFTDITKQGVSFRLPNDTFPIRYDISLTTRIDLGDFAFTGNVIINLQVKSATSVITLHSKLLAIGTIELTRATTQQVITVTHTLDEPLEFLIITAATGLVVGEIYVLEIHYSSTLREDNGGFYRSSYVNEAGVTKWLATTQFERTEARHAFPSYDEPGIRAIYGLKITHAKAYTAVSNMPMFEEISVDDDTVTTVYLDTPIMQTYLLAFVISDFSIISNNATKSPTDLLQQIVGRPVSLRTGEADFALEAGIKILKGMETHFNFKYPLPKMDQAGIPDFGGGAMENWGLVTYRESALYYNPVTSAMSQKEYVASIVAHEFAHQWFGNIISPTWWEFIWLNEGFATLYEYVAADWAYPEFRYNDMMVVLVLQSVFQRDALEATRPMNTYYESPADLRTLFDFVAYDKSGCVLRMVQHFLTDATFTKGLNYYFEDMKYKAANPYDLYRNWELAASEDDTNPASAQLQPIMDSWTYQKGYPAIMVTRNDAGVITVTQERFLLNKLPTSQALSWWIPYNFVVANTPDFSKTIPNGWIPQGTATITIEASTERTWTNDEWVLFNKQQTGYYRVNYDARLWELLVAELKDGDFNKIHLLNRAQLIDDAYTFASIGQAKYHTALSLMEYLSKEMNYVPWVAANRALTVLDRMVSGTGEIHEHLNDFINDISKPLFAKLGVRIINNEPYFDRLARNIVMKWACYTGNEDCIKAANDRVKEFISTNVLFEADSRSTIMCNGLRQANETDFLAVWSKQQASNITADRSLLITGLGCSQNADLLKLLLETTVATTDVNYTAAERSAVLTAVINGGIVGVETMISFLDQHGVQAANMYDLNAPITSMASWITAANHVTAFNALVDKLYAAGHITDVAAKATAASNAAWLVASFDDIQGFMNEYANDDGGASSLVVSSVMLVISVVVTVFKNYF